MTYSNTDFTAELRAVPDPNPPPCAVDLDVVLARGTALRRRRRVLGVGGGLVAAGLAVVLIVALVPEHPGLSPAPSPPAGGSPRSTAGSDPLTTDVSFGWLPAGLHLSGGETHTVIASNGTTEFDATVLDPGDQPAAGCGTPVGYKAAPGTPLGEGPQNSCYAAAPDVDGHAAFWNIAPSGARPNSNGYVELVWECAPRTWAFVDANVGDDTSSDIVGTVYKVAESVRIGAPERVPLPFHLPAVPKGMRLEMVMWRDGPLAARAFQPRENWLGADLTYGIPYPKANPPAAIDFETTQSGSSFPTSVELQAGGDPVPAKDVRHLTVDGHQAIEVDVTAAQHTPIESLTIHDIGGEDFTLTVVAKQAVEYVDGQGGIVAYFDSTHVFGGTDPNGWTTDVVG